MFSTRVGYAGGTTADPTYYSIGDHSESVQVRYEPSIISYQDLLDVFWNYHNPTQPAYSKQYQSIIFYHNEQQKRLAEASKAAREKELGAEVFTEIVPAGEFYSAETYHQKYQLQSNLELMRLLAPLFPTNDDFIDSTLTARLNGYMGGQISLQELEDDLRAMDLSPELVNQILEVLHPTS